MISPEQVEEMSSLIATAMSDTSKQAAYFVDMCYVKDGNDVVQNISYTVAVLRSLLEPSIAQVVLELGGSFDAAALWEIVVSLSSSAVGDLFTKADGRLLQDAIIVSGKTVTYHSPNVAEDENEI